MKKFVLLLFLIGIFGLFSCSSKNYELSKSPVAVFKTSKGDFKVQFYKSASPKAVKLFIDFVKKGKYNDTVVDEIIFHEYLITLGMGSKTFDPNLKEDFSKEIVPEKRKLEKNEIMFDSRNEGFGAFNIYTGSMAQEIQAPLVVFGKVIEGDKTLTEIMNIRVDTKFKPVDPVKIIEVTVK